MHTQSTIQERFQGAEKGYVFDDVVDLSEEEKEHYRGCGLYHVQVRQGVIERMTYLEDMDSNTRLDTLEENITKAPDAEHYTANGSCCQLMEFSQIVCLQN